jgi:hypothetical protein
MITRREFTYFSSASLISLAVPRFITFDDGVKVNGEFQFSNTGGAWRLKATDVTIDGLSIPKFTWAWIGLGIAQGVLNGIGAGLFGALANAIFGGTQKSMEQLLKEQLVAFAQILQEAIDANELRRYGSNLAAYITLYKEYSRTPSTEGLRYLQQGTAIAMSNLESLGLTAYRTYMTAAGLRLSILQEAIKRKIATYADFEEQRKASIDFHAGAVKFIDNQTDPFVQVGERPCFYPFGGANFEKKILGREVIGVLVCNGKGHVASADESSRFIEQYHRDLKKPPIFKPINYVDWISLRNIVKAETTDLGQKMIDRWRGVEKKSLEVA